MNQNKLPMIHFLVLGLLMVVAGVLFSVSLKKVAATKKLESEVAQMATARAKLGNLEIYLPTIEAEVSGWAKTLPVSEGDVALYASLVEQAGRGQGLTVALNFDDFPKLLDGGGKKIYGLGVDMALEGSFSGLTNFLSILSSQPYFFKIDKLTIIQSPSHHGVKAILDGVLVMSEKKQ